VFRSGVLQGSTTRGDCEMGGAGGGREEGTESPHHTAIPAGAPPRVGTVVTRERDRRGGDVTVRV
jgi:hypothetical protein